MDALFALIFLAIWIGMIVGAVAIANNKGRSPVIWGLLTAFFGLIPLIIVAVLPATETAPTSGY